MSTFSIYIPRISNEHTAEYIKWYFNKCNIGTVTHVDFTQINKKPGFAERVDEVVRSAFVHFEKHLEHFIYMENYFFWKTIAAGKPYKLQVSQFEYWLCLKNNNPIQRTMMNIHQVVENGRYLENLIESQSKTIQEQTEKLKELESKLKGTHSVINELFKKLLNKSNKKNLKPYTDDLFTGKKDDEYNDINKWYNWLTVIS